MFIRVKTKIVEKSDYTRKLETVVELEKILDQVNQYKAMSKLHDLMYTKTEKGMNKHYSGLIKGQWGYSISDRYGYQEFYFYNVNDRSRDYAIEFRVEEKSIPEIITKLAEYKAKLIQWQSAENQVSVSDYKFGQAIDDTFQGELTPAQFEAKKLALIRYLKELTEAVKDIAITTD